jgi:4-carboxymuconolactone decarboxylase
MSDPRIRAERGLDCLNTIAGSPEAGQQLADFFETRGALGSFAHLTAAGEIWAREQISRRDRSVIVISTLTALAREVELRQHVAGGLNHGLSIDEVDEIMVQLSAYVGLPFALAGSLAIDQVIAEREGGETRKAPRAPATVQENEQRRAAGLDVLTTLLGDPNLDKAATERAILDQQGDMGALVMDYAFGDVWSRPQLSRRDRSLIVVSALTAINMTHELEIHIGAGFNHGLTPTEIEEVMITMVAYGGFPRAIDGMLLARKVFTARGLLG